MTSLITKKVEISRIPGFGRDRFPMVDGLQPGLNVVWGPNAAGKSSLARAMRSLLWPQQGGDIEAVASVEIAGDAWRLERRGDHLHQIRLVDNHMSQSQWGKEDDAFRYWFPLHELLQVNQKGELFAIHIQRQLHGGIDLAKACREANGTKTPVSGNCSEIKRQKNALKRVQEVKSLQGQHKGLQGSIESLEAQLEDAKKASGRLKTVQTALEVRRAEARIRALERELANLPEEVGRLSKEDPKRWNELSDQEDSIRDEVKRLRGQIKDKDDECRSHGLSEEWLGDEGQRHLLEGLIDSFKTAEDSLQEADRRLKVSRDAELLWRQEHAWICPNPHESPHLDSFIQRLKELSAQCEPVRCRLQAAKEVAQQLGRKEEPASQAEDRLPELQTRLGDWLRLMQQTSTVNPGEVPRSRVSLYTGISIGVLLGAGLLAIVVTPWLALLGLLVPVLGMVLLRPAGSKGASEASNQVEVIQGQVKSLLRNWPDLEPVAWSMETVLELRQKISERLGRNAIREERNRSRECAQTALGEAQKDYQTWTENWGSAVRDLGLRAEDPTLEGAQFFHFSTHLFHWLELIQKLGEAETEYRNLLAEQVALAKRLQGMLQANACPNPSSDARELLAQAKDLQDSRALVLQLLRERKGLLDQVSNAEERLDGVHRRIAEFWRDLGFNGEDPERLLAAAARVEEWTRIKHALELTTLKLEELKLELGADDPEGGVEELEQEADQLRAAGEFIERRREELGKLKQSYEQLLNGGDLAEALKERREAETQVLRLRQENLVNRVVDLLTKRLEDRASKEDQPAVLQKANAWLERFTQARYQLGIDSKGEFFAYDTTKEENFPLEALSSGTRIQLLFAVRLAFIDEMEGPDGVRLPLFLDEILANSDDERARAIIQVIFEIARDRQVFYFTAQADELGKLQELAGLEGLHEVPLGRLAQDRAQASSPLKSIAVRQIVVPDPVPDYLEFGRLCGASGAAIFDPIGSLHAWHAFARSQDLHPFLQRGFSRLGQLRLSSRKEDEPIRTRISLLERAQELAQVGRGRPFGPSDLVEADLPFLSRTAGYWNSLLEVARVSGGDAQIFKQSWNGIPRLRQEAKDSLEAWLIEKGFLTEVSDSMDPDEILDRLHRDFAWLKVDSDDQKVVERYVLGVLAK